MAANVEYNYSTDWDRSISETASPVAEINLGGHQVHLSDAAARLRRLDAQVDAIRLSLMEMYVYVIVCQAETRRRAIDACLAAGLQKLPVDRLAGEVHRVIAEIVGEAQ
ncbi:hypothetical protein H7849_23790 [Alloacidobacterium dinghuense]|uniref:Uncharacterized protein n=1 Tax=Alloacidobacterium dinghuense TaxID=2763107 RepID=A0A7G8BHH8_9BACT|nr:hypothetical protein [Alloacidobacterium dinghuense]QNI31998.1 hypothetical protein H7849_23790 [Alloacidobacterium dinghuense]